MSSCFKSKERRNWLFGGKGKFITWERECWEIVTRSKVEAELLFSIEVSSFIPKEFQAGKVSVLLGLDSKEEFLRKLVLER